jgi:primosomal protein N' (replication factor Y)
MIARVTLELALRKEFDYLIPPELQSHIEVGTRVQVPFGPGRVLGCVTGLAEQSDRPRLKPILKVIGAQSLVTPEVIRLARWMAEYYCCPPETALKSVLPEAVRHEKAGWQEQLYVEPMDAPAGVRPLPKRQAEVLQIIKLRAEMRLTELLKEARTTLATVRRLEDRGLITIAPRVMERDPYARDTIVPSNPLPLNPPQQAAFERIRTCLLGAKSGGAAAKGTPQTPSTFLLHGVTGSGKTEVYLQAIAAALELGKGAIVLVPEISLTPQTVERFKARFSHGTHKTLVAVLHSHLSSGERHDEWHKIRQGRARIAIGARSAVFAPVAALGLIVVDEEHEHTYKQEEAPRYHARDVAVMRGQMEGAVVVLGSATPSLESYYNAQRGKYTLLELTERADSAKMPHVRVVDMRQAVRKNGGIPVFSPQLKDAITQRLELREQTILFLNRRGYSSFLECPLCGYVAQCPNCSVALTFHRTERKLACHICGHLAPVPAICPNDRCRNPRIRYGGLGTERVEETLTKLFPKARVRRMDSDVMKRKEDYRRVLGDFRTGKIDILVGTQMIAKGLHFPNVTLVGIVYADMTLHQPDFRAAERTFQLLTQVAGRAGRGEIEGEVFVQSFTPFHAAIQCARRHDFTSFFDQETEFRRQLSYPPFSRVALLTLKGRNEDKVKLSADHVRKLLQSALAGLEGLVLGQPGPAPLLRAHGFYRYQVLLRTPRIRVVSERLAKLQQDLVLPEGVTLSIDIDPVDLS